MFQKVKFVVESIVPIQLFFITHSTILPTCRWDKICERSHSREYYVRIAAAMVEIVNLNI